MDSVAVKYDIGILRDPGKEWRDDSKGEGISERRKGGNKSEEVIDILTSSKTKLLV